MQSRREQVHAYQFFMQRVVSGLVARESDPAELPFRRLGGAALGSLMVAVLTLAAVGVYGFVVGGGATSWRDGNLVIVEKESGTRYVYRDGRLYPVVNLTSAWLLLERNAEVKLVSAKSLVGVARGPSLGIPGAPEGLPGGDRLLTGNWSLCTHAVTDDAGDRHATSVLAIGALPAGGSDLDSSGSLLVRDADKRSALYLVWNGHSFPIKDGEPVLRALGRTEEQAMPVARAWLDALPTGETLRTPDTDRGAPTDALDDVSPDEVLSGQVIEAPAGTYYFVRPNSLRPISPLQKDILLADPDTAEAYPDGAPRVVSLSTAALANAAIEPAPQRSSTTPPERRPDPAATSPEDFRDGAVCATFAPAASAPDASAADASAPDAFVPTVRVGGRASGGAGMDTPQRTEDGALLVDRVQLTPGWAALVEAMSSPEAEHGTLHLVTDQGIRYGLASAAVATMLGYDPSRAVRVPASLLDRVPAGPALDPVAAGRPISAA